MKFVMRFVNQIVGALIILALGILVFVIFMLGSSQRWFARDYQYKTYFSSAAGLSPNMPVQYKGFTIGHVKSIKLTEDDRVEVIFNIFDTYNNRVKQGSLIELQTSPIGALGGNQFMFHPGTGREQIDEGETIPEIGSVEGKRVLALGLTVLPEKDDGISNIMNQVGTLLSTLNNTLFDIQQAIEGTDSTSLGRTLGGVEATMQELLPNIQQILGDVTAQLKPVLENLGKITAALSDPNGTVMDILDSQGPVYQELIASLHAITGTLRNVEKTTDFIPAQLPQIAVLLSDLHTTLKAAEDVLVSLTNNPLLKGGIPEPVETPTGGTRPRDIQF
jgi:phospholipid/cholesterol/gamma-HCH transport system substrate-binding protein